MIPIKLRALIFLTVSVLSNPLQGSSTSAPEITYTLTPHLSKSNYHLKVKASFTGNHSGETIIQFPDNWGNGQQGKALKNIYLESEGVALSLTKEENPGYKKVKHKPQASLKLSYEIHSTLVEEQHLHWVHGAILEKDFIHATGHALFAIPQVGENPTYKISWRNLAKEWAPVSSYGLNPEIEIKGEKAGEKLLHAIYIARKPSRLYQFKIHGHPVYVSLQGKFQEKDEDLLNHLKKITEAQRAFFSDYDFPFYFFSLVEGQISGSAFKNCFVASIPQKAAPKDYLLMLSHEHMHTWIGDKIKIEGDGPFYWWSEGFTDYYSPYFLYQAGLLSQEEVVNETNSHLIRYYTSPVRNEPNEKIAKEFWEKPEMKMLAYNRGFVFAFWLDGFIRAKTDNKASLDNVMKGILSKTLKTKEAFTPKLLTQIIQEISGEDITDYLQQYIEEGQTIPLEDTYGDFPIKQKELYSFDLGFSLEDLVKHKKITHLNTESEAYKAGLREGDAIEKRDLINVGDSEQTISMTVSGKTLQFQPRGKSAIEIPQLVIKTPEDKEAVEKWFLKYK